MELVHLDKQMFMNKSILKSYFQDRFAFGTMLFKHHDF